MIDLYLKLKYLYWIPKYSVLSFLCFPIFLSSLHTICNLTAVFISPLTTGLTSAPLFHLCIYSTTQSSIIILWPAVVLSLLIDNVLLPLQWYDALRSMARLPFGIPPEFRRKMWLSLADWHIKRLKVDWQKTVRTAFNDRTNPDDDKLGSQIVKVWKFGSLFWQDWDGQWIFLVVMDIVV